MPGWRTALLACCLPLVVATAQPAPGPQPGAPELRFAFPMAPAASLPLAEQVLTEEERAFVATMPEIRVALPQPSPRPYEVLNGRQVGGIHPDMLMAIAQTFGLRLKPVWMPNWTAALEAARTHEVDLLMTLGATEERLGYLDFTLGATPRPGGLYTRRGHVPDDLHQARFVVERDYITAELLAREYPEAPVLMVETTSQALSALAEGRADAYIGSLLEVTELLGHTPRREIALSRLMNLGSGYYHFAVRKDWPMLVRILNKGIASTRGVTDQAMRTWLQPWGSAWQPPTSLNLSLEDYANLARRSVWRVGAVRGLSLLNDAVDNGGHQGIVADYMDHVAQQLGVALQVVPFDTMDELLAGLRRGEVDVAPQLTRTPQRAQEFAFSDPYLDMPYVLVAGTGAPLFWDLGNLRGHRLALPRDHPLRELIEDRYPGITLVDARDSRDALARVLRGEADATVDVRLSTNLFLNGEGAGQLRTLGEVRELPAAFQFAVRMEDEDLVPLINRALHAIPDEARARMLHRWVAAPLPPSGLAGLWRLYRSEVLTAAAALLALGLATALWMRRLSREVQARRRSEQLLSDVAATVPGIAFRYVMGADGRLLHHYFTPNAQRFLGIPLDPRRTVLAAVRDRLRPEQAAEADAAEARAMATGEPFKMTAAYRHPVHGERWMQCEAVMTRQTGHTLVWTGYVVDVTTERDLQARLAEEARSRMLVLASASHELRAPTHTLALALQSLPPEPLTADQRRCLRIAQDAAQTLGQLLNDVLDAAQLDAGELQLRPQPVALPPLIDEVARAWRVAALDKGLAFSASVAPDVPALVLLDPLRVRQVLTNLLSNACKYTLAGEVRLSVAMAGAHTLSVRVQDTGIGIPATDRPLLFRPFAVGGGQAASMATREGRSGLGLSICARLVGLMGGEIALEEPGTETRGPFHTSFHVRIPLPALPAQTLARYGGAAQAAVPAESNGCVLVCDDDDTCRLLMAQMLRSLGFEVAEAATGEAALARWRAGGIRAVVCDLQMPGMGGEAFLRRLREEDTEGRTAIIICSGNLAPPAPTATTGHPLPLFDAYLAKPTRADTLAATLRSLGRVPTPHAG